MGVLPVYWTYSWYSPLPGDMGDLGGAPSSCEEPPREGERARDTAAAMQTPGQLTIAQGSSSWATAMLLMSSLPSEERTWARILSHRTRKTITATAPHTTWSPDRTWRRTALRRTDPWRQPISVKVTQRKAEKRQKNATSPITAIWYAL